MASLPSITKKLPPDFLKSLREGMIAGAVVLLLMAGWMVLRWQDTARNLQEDIPAKTAPISEAPPVNTGTKELDEALQSGRQITPLPPAPIEGLSEETPDGLSLPMTRISDDLSPFAAYKKPYEPVKGKPMIAFAVVDYGLSDALAHSMIDNLPAEVSFVLSPYAGDPVKWAAAARAYGHEFWLGLPMQGKDFGTGDTGPKTILKNAALEENRKRLFATMTMVQGYAGLVSQKDHVFGANEPDVAPLMEQVFGRGLAFVESNPDIAAFGLGKALEFNYPYGQNNFWLDADLRPDAIDHVLKAAALQATQKGRAIVFLHPYPISVKKMQDWISQAADSGIDVAPLSALIVE